MGLKNHLLSIVYVSIVLITFEIKVHGNILWCFAFFFLSLQHSAFSTTTACSCTAFVPTGQVGKAAERTLKASLNSFAQKHL